MAIGPSPPRGEGIIPLQRPVAVLVFLAASAGAGIIAADTRAGNNGLLLDGNMGWIVIVVTM